MLQEKYDRGRSEGPGDHRKGTSGRLRPDWLEKGKVAQMSKLTQSKSLFVGGEQEGVGTRKLDGE